MEKSLIYLSNRNIDNMNENHINLFIIFANIYRENNSIKIVEDNIKDSIQVMNVGSYLEKINNKIFLKQNLIKNFELLHNIQLEKEDIDCFDRIYNFMNNLEDKELFEILRNLDCYDFIIGTNKIPYNLSNHDKQYLSLLFIPKK